VKELLDNPIADAQFIMQERFPMPRFFVTKPGDTNERKLKVRVNPSSLNADNTTAKSGNFNSEDVSLNVFMQHLIKMAVA
jgi:protein transport protein SEC23